MIRYTYGYSRDVDPDALYWHLLKRAAAVMTPEAMQAGPEGMPPQGAPMDPSMMQGGMPPQGAPMDPSMMQGGMPPQGGGLPPEILQDQAFVQMLQQSGVVLDPQSGMFMDPSGQPVPPEMIVQAYEAYMQGQQAGQAGPGGMPPQGAPMDPSMAQGAMPPQGAPMDPSMAQAGPGEIPPQGAPVDPSMVQGAPTGGPEADGMLPEPVMNAISSIVASTVEPAVQDLASQLGQALSDLAAKIDELSARLDAEKKEGAPSAEDVLRSEIEKDLQQQQQQQLPQEEAVPQMKAASVSGGARSQLKPLNIFSLMSQNK